MCVRYISENLEQLLMVSQIISCNDQRASLQMKDITACSVLHGEIYCWKFGLNEPFSGKKRGDPMLNCKTGLQWIGLQWNHTFS